MTRSKSAKSSPSNAKSSPSNLGGLNRDVCVVHHDAQTAERLHRECDKLANLFRFPNIARLEGGARVATSNDGFPALLIDVCDDNPRALLEKAQS
jgi:hypothetical protein